MKVFDIKHTPGSYIHPFTTKKQLHSLKLLRSPNLIRCCSPSPCFPKSKPFFSSSFEFSPWSSLQSWRDSPLNKNRFWGPNGPQTPPSASSIHTNDPSFDSASSLAQLGALVLSTSDPLSKSRLSHLAFSRWRNEKLPIGTYDAPSKPAGPPRPEMVSQLPKDSGLPLNAYMLHNLAHVELNAIDLAWDTVVRFSPFSEILGEGFFADFAHVADDESRHFAWCSQRLDELGFKYGDMPAHNLLWRECEKSSDDVAARLAIIPLVQVFHVLQLGGGQDITALALNNDSTNLLVSTADKQLIIFTDPALSLK